MLDCGWCGAEVPPGLEYCPNCGHQYVAMQTCPRCGAQVPINIRLCASCGAFLDGAAIRATSAGIIPPANQLPQQAMPASAGYYPQPQTVAAGARKKELWMKGQPLDPWYIAAISFAVAAAMFYWVPTLGIALSIIGLVAAGIGWFRFWQLRGEHSGTWLNIAATVILIAALIFSIKWSGRLEHAAVHGLLYIRYHV